MTDSNLPALFAEIILPTALPRPTFTYQIPPELAEKVRFGVRVEVNFGKNRLFAGIVARLSDRQPDDFFRIKPILSVLDEQPVITEIQLKLWEWMASYYCCTLGEVMAAALPAHLRLSSETRLIRNEAFGDDFAGLSNDEYLVAEALLVQNEISIDDTRAILQKKTVYPVIKSLLERGVLFIKEELQEKYRPKKVGCVRLTDELKTQSDLLKNAFSELSKSEKQTTALMAVIQLSRQQEFVKRQEVIDRAEISAGILAALEKKGFVEFYEKEVSRISGFEDELAIADELSAQQTRVIQEIQSDFLSKNTILLHGVTGSGKTRVYVELMKKIIETGGQVLYLLPEIALTTQIISRLETVFGNDIAVYHSRVSNNERVDLWRAAAAGKPVILAARSGIFLPFSNLQLVIIDEEHDASFKQTDPDPRYSGRDAGLVLASFFRAKTLLGTATPSVETWHHTTTGKYGLVEMPERFGGLQLPEIQLVNLVEQAQRKLMQSHFSTPLIERLKVALTNGEQAILFQNRRGYAPIYFCETCSWKSECKNCDVSLTWHQASEHLRCHYCGFQQPLPKKCPACGGSKLILRGFGTEKIEEELPLFLPSAKIARMDLDTVSGKTALLRLINDFEEKRIDVLVGTQMVTKGLDFENVALVGVLGADQLLGFPDFRANERAFQLLTQVAGRAGRKKKRGLVLIQTWKPDHPILQEVVRGDWQGFFNREIGERKEFNYPPFSRLIHISVKHKKPETCFSAAKLFAHWLKKELGERVHGPAVPGVARVRSFYHMDFMLKIERDTRKLAEVKRFILQKAQELVGESGYGNVGIEIDVDPV